ncbi:MAG: peptidoglycan DD-metalloendopeptidase family protein [Pseudomonadota bacterium]
MALTLPLLVATSAPAANDQAEKEALQAGESELKGLQDQLSAANERKKSLSAKIKALHNETEALSGRLISMAARVQAREAKITEGEERLAQLDLEEKALKAQLKRRRKALAELLAGLQRLEQNPPPALIVKPNDALSALRSAMLLGAIVPELKNEAQAISRNLSRLLELRAAIKQERKGLETNVSRLRQEREEIEALLAEKQVLSKRTRAELGEYRDLTRELARQAKGLKSLITILEKKRQERKEAERRLAAQLAKEKAAEAERQKVAEERRRLEEKRRLAILDAPRVQFTKAKGLISYPAQGERLYTYGDKKPDGNRAKGIALATRSNAQVTAPADGTVVYAAEFRSYGRLLIINAGEGYHLLLAGLGNITVTAGQAIRAGEPIGSMGEKAASGVVGAEIGDDRPVLYVEFRKNGNSIDSRPWWAGSSS